MFPDTSSFSCINKNQSFPVRKKSELVKFLKKQDEAIYFNDSTGKDTGIIFQNRISNPDSYKTSFLNYSHKTLKEINSFNYYKTDWLSWFLIFCFIIYAFLQKNFNRKQKAVINSFFNYSNKNQLLREGNLYNETGFYFLLFLSLLSVCLLLMHGFVYTYFGTYTSVNSFLLFLQISSVFLSLYFGKILLMRILSFIFKLNKLYSDFVLSHHLFIITLGITSLFISTILIFASNYMLIICSVIIGIGLYINFILRLYIVNLSIGFFSLYYYILYICSVEILPVLIIYKLIIK